MPHHWMTDLGNCIAAPGPGSFVQGTPQTAGAEAEITSGEYDRLVDLLGYYHSAVGFVHGNVTQASASTTLSFTGVYEHSDSSGSGFVTLGTATATKVVQTGSGQYTFQLENLDLSQAKQFVRFKITPNFEAASVDTTVFSGLLVVGGAQNNPTDKQ